MGLGHPKNDFELFETMFKSLRGVFVCVRVSKTICVESLQFYRSKLKPS